MTLDDKTRNTKNENVNKSKDSHKNPTKSNPRINTNVSVKNIKVHIAEMSACDNAGFKDEYNVIFKIFFSSLTDVFFCHKKIVISDNKSVFCQIHLTEH